MTKVFRRAAMKLAFAATIFSSVAAAASAQNYVTQPRAENYIATYDGKVPSAGLETHDPDHSGTRGRLGLGASPAHPEGPGNVSN